MHKNRRKQKNKIFIGTSGWIYKSWHKKFYPKNQKKDFLSYYANHYNSVEINTSFYHLPKKETFEKWRKETPAYFICAVKMSRYITHIRRLKNCKIPINRFFAHAKSLGRKLGSVLIQLPPSLPYSRVRLTKFLKDLDASRKRLKIQAKFALEPRNETWFASENFGEIRSVLEKQRIALVFAHSSVLPNYDPEDEKNITTNFIYVRFHGPKEFAASQYGLRRLKPWAKRIKQWSDNGKTIFAYFNDDARGYAIKDARILAELTKQ